MDVEPYLYSGWNTNRAATVKAYQALLMKAVSSTNALNLPLEADLPFWFDEIPYKNTYGSGVLAEWVIANTHSVTLMAYRDSATMITELVRNEVAYGVKYGKPVVVGVETGQTDEGEATLKRFYLEKNRKAANKCRSKQKQQQDELVETARDVERFLYFPNKETADSV